MITGDGTTELLLTVGWAPNSLLCADGAVKNLLTHSLFADCKDYLQLNLTELHYKIQ